MFLAVKEIRHEKLRYGLIIGMIVLIGYLMFMLMGMMLGLANENTAAIDSWDAKSVVLNKNSNISLSQSLIAKQDLPELNDHQALVGQTPAVIERAKGATDKQTIRFVGLDSSQFIYQKKMKLSSGHKPHGKNQVVLDEGLKSKGYRLGDQITLNGSTQKYRVVGFAKDAKLNIASIVYGSLTTWQTLKGTGDQFAASGIFSDQKQTVKNKNLKQYSIGTFIDKLPGYAAQNMTFEFMIAFLMVISLIVITVFLYILTMQKIPNYAVLRAQGIPAAYLIGATIGQAVILMVSGTLDALLLMIVSKAAMPSSVPMLINWPLTGILSLALVVLGVAGSLLPVRMISRIDPLDAMR